MQINHELHKTQLQSYFDGEGFARWKLIYGEGPISGVRKSVREGHGRVVAQTLTWLGETRRHGDGETQKHGDSTISSFPLSPSPHLPVSPSPRLNSILDAGCGTGMLTLALAQQGWDVTAVDIAPQMVAATAAAAQAAGLHVHMVTGDLEVVEGAFDAVVCLDVLIHYPAELFVPMLTGLAARTRGPLVFTYSPREPLLAALHWVGGRFPKPQRRTEIQMLPSSLVAGTLAQAGMHIRRETRVSAGFYHVALVEAERD